MEIVQNPIVVTLQSPSIIQLQLGGQLDDADLPSSLARDTEVDAKIAVASASNQQAAALLVAAHESAPDPHPQYTTGIEATAAVNLGIAAHEQAINPHPQYSAAATALQPSAIGSTVQAFDSDLAAIAALSTTAYGRGLLTLADAAAARSNLGLGTAATQTIAAFATATQGSLADAALQPSAIGSTIQAFDSDLAAIAALTTTTYGRSILTLDTLRLGTAGSAIGDLWRNGDVLQYRDSSNATRLLLNATDNLANLASTSTARSNLGLSKFQILYQSFVAETITGTTSEVAYTTQYTIPGGTLTAGSTLYIRPSLSMSTSSGSRTCKIKIGSTTISSTSLVNTLVGFETERVLRFRSLSSQFTHGVSIVQALSGAGSPVQYVNFDFSQPQTISISMQSPQTTDTATLETLQIWEIRP